MVARRRHSRAVVFDFDDTLAVGTAYPEADPSELFGGHDRLADMHGVLSQLAREDVLITVCSFNQAAVIWPILEGARLSHFFNQQLVFGSEVFHLDGALRVALREKYGVKHVRTWNKGTVIRELIEPWLETASRGVSDGFSVFDEDVPPDLTFDAQRIVPATITIPNYDSLRSSLDGTSAILFVDDDPTNVREVHEGVRRCATILVPESPGGMQAEHFRAVLDWEMATRSAVHRRGAHCDARREDGGCGDESDGGNTRGSIKHSDAMPGEMV